MSYPMTDLERQYLAAAERGDIEEAQRLEALVDAEQEAHQARLAAPGALLNAALWYATTLKLPVFPCVAGWKNPALPSAHPVGDPLRGTCKGECGRHGHGFHDATTDTDQIRAWWNTNPEHNVAAPTGHLFDVFDIDGPEGMIAIGDYMDAGEFPHPLAMALTPRGRHYFVPVANRTNTTKLLPQVDYRGNGGYVVLPPSRTTDGTYQWSTPLTPTTV